MARSATFSSQPDAAALLAQAEAETGLHDFGVDGSQAPGNRAPLYWEIARPSPPPSLAAPGDPRVAEGTDDEYYAAHRLLLQHLQFGAPRRRWVLKGVEHQFRLSALLAAYPDAKLVWPHRDPVEVFGSLLAVIGMVYAHSGAPVPADRRAFSLAMLDTFQQRVDKALADPASSGDSVCHVSYPDLTADPVAVVHAVYKHFGLPLDGVAPAVQAWLDDPGNRSDRYGKWTYDLAGHEVSADELGERFGSYRARCGL